MTSPNHIVGGIAITGISLSFWDINIFSSLSFLSLCVFASLLPDIDHTKSIIGKAFYPLAKYLDRSFGHRTLTHSLTALVPLFIFLLFLELNIINPYFEQKGIPYSLIFLFSYLSHLILDMMTIQGVPLFYPFLKNPCVIPANQKLRFRSGNIKSEAFALFIFTFVLFTSFDLFQNGFWTTYNRSFGTIKHAFREFKNSENVVNVEYQYSFNGVPEKGKAQILDATEKSVDLLTEKNKIVIINSEDLRFKKIEIKPFKTDFKYTVTDFTFFNLSLEKLNDTLKNKVVSGKVSSPVDFAVNRLESKKGILKLSKTVSPIFNLTKMDSSKNSIQEKLALKKSRLKEIQSSNYKKRRVLVNAQNNLKRYLSAVQFASTIYDRNELDRLIIEERKKIKDFTLKLTDTNTLMLEIELLSKEAKKREEPFFSGSLKVFSSSGPKRILQKKEPLYLSDNQNNTFKK